MERADMYLGAHEAAIGLNQQSAHYWDKYKNDLNCTKDLLKQLPLSLSKEVLVPLGKLAFMPGKIVHTNEFLISIGSGYFTKTTASDASNYCDRRLKDCETSLKQLEIEHNLLTNKLQMPGKVDAFGAPDRPEIIEHMTEEEHGQWMDQHKKRQAREKLSKLKEKEKIQIETEKDLWDRLDQLELEEELEDELHRLHDDDVTDDDDDDVTDDDDNDDVTDDYRNNQDQCNLNKKDHIVSEENLSEKKEPKRKRSVIFADNDVTPPLVLTFTHSSEQAATDSKELNPSHIFSKYIRDLQTTNPPPILKVKVNPNKAKEVSNLSQCEGSSDEETQAKKTVLPGYVIPNIPQVTDVMNKTNKEVIAPRGVSKFKASRLQAQR